MVHLTLTPALQAALESYSTLYPLSTLSPDPSDPILALDSPLHSPITHAQILAVFHALKLHNPNSHPHLPALLRNTTIYIPPTKPKPQKTAEYTSLMARLRAEAEGREYEQMTRQKSSGAWGGGAGKATQNPFSKWAVPSEAAAWDLGGGRSEAAPWGGRKGDDEEVSMREINAQLSLVVNVLVSILAFGVTCFLLLRYTPWSDAVRVLVSMLGALVVGVAEVVLYVGYVRRTGEAKTRERGRKEERTVGETWIIESRSRKEIATQRLEETKVGSDESDAVRRRKRKIK